MIWNQTHPEYSLGSKEHAKENPLDHETPYIFSYRAHDTVTLWLQKSRHLFEKQRLSS